MFKFAPKESSLCFRELNFASKELGLRSENFSQFCYQNGDPCEKLESEGKEVLRFAEHYIDRCYETVSYKMKIK